MIIAFLFFICFSLYPLPSPSPSHTNNVYNEIDLFLLRVLRWHQNQSVHHKPPTTFALFFRLIFSVVVTKSKIYCWHSCSSPATKTMHTQLNAFIESIHIVEAVKGTIGRLPCNITPSVNGDKIILVIWYKDGYTLPIYR